MSQLVTGQPCAVHTLLATHCKISLHNMDLCLI